MVHTVQMEEGLQSFRRLGQAAAPFVRPRAETVAEPTPEFANATLILLCQLPANTEYCQFPTHTVKHIASQNFVQSVTESNRVVVVVIVIIIDAIVTKLLLLLLPRRWRQYTRAIYTRANRMVRVVYHRSRISEYTYSTISSTILRNRST